jgi:hypothetical protein
LRALGVRSIHADRLNNGKLVPKELEVLMDEPQPGESRQLVAIKSIVWEKDSPSRSPPSFSGPAPAP